MSLLEQVPSPYGPIQLVVTADAALRMAGANPVINLNTLLVVGISRKKVGGDNYQLAEDVNYFEIAFWDGNMIEQVMHLTKGDKITVIPRSIYAEGWVGDDGKARGKNKMRVAQIVSIERKTKRSYTGATPAPANTEAAYAHAGAEAFDEDSIPF